MLNRKIRSTDISKQTTKAEKRRPPRLTESPVQSFAHHLGVTAWTPRYPVVTIFSGKEPLRTYQKRLSSR